MDTFVELIGFAIAGLVAALTLVYFAGRHRALGIAKKYIDDRTPTPEPQPEPAPTPESEPEPFAGAPEVSSLTVKLHSLASDFEAFGDNSAHPRDLAQHAQFKEAVALLVDLAVPVETVQQYATGANWGLSCAALVALAQRDDGGEIAGEIADQFGQLRPWAMYFALDYLAETDPRPAAGAPAVAAKEWWSNNFLIPTAFRDYFTRRQRLGDSAVFGHALNMHGASPPAEIEGFLKRLNHPFATALIDDLMSFQHRNIDREFLRSFGRFWNPREDCDLLIEAEP